MFYSFLSKLYSLFNLKIADFENHLEKCSDPEKPDLSILFIGNSFTYYDNMPLQLVNLAKERFPDKQLRVYFQAGPGLKLGMHAEDKRTQETLLNNGKWDIVVLQDQSEMALRPFTTQIMRLNCRWFDKRIKQVHGKTALLMTWCDLSLPDDQVPISKGYRDVARQLKATVIPAGELFLEVTQKSPEISLYGEDQHHPSHYGSFLVACLTENILLHTKDELVELVTKRKNGETVLRADPIEQRLVEYADDFAIREMSRLV